MPLEISDRGGKDMRSILEQAETGLAVETQNSSHLTGFVVMIYVLRRTIATYRTTLILLESQFFQPVAAKAILTFEVRLGTFDAHAPFAVAAQAGFRALIREPLVYSNKALTSTTKSMTWWRRTAVVSQ